MQVMLFFDKTCEVVKKVINMSDNYIHCSLENQDKVDMNKGSIDLLNTVLGNINAFTFYDAINGKKVDIKDHWDFDIVDDNKNIIFTSVEKMDDEGKIIFTSNHLISDDALLNNIKNLIELANFDRNESGFGSMLSNLSIN